MATVQEVPQETWQSFECPNCGASLVYGADLEKLVCGYCDTTHEVEAVAEASAHTGETPLEDLLDLKLAPAEPEKMLECEQCGACITVSGTRSAGHCSFCASELVKERESDSERVMPTALIPFKIDREAASKAYRKWLASLWLRPNDLTRSARVAALEGVYAPFWTFDVASESRWTAESGTTYYETETYRDAQGKRQTRTVAHTNWKPARGSRRGEYDDVLVSGSRGLDKEMLSELEPFHTVTSLKPYQPEFLAGWSAEQCAVSAQEAWAEARQRVRDSEYSKCGQEVPGDRHRHLQVSTRLSDMTGRHILLPVWIAAYRYGDKTFHFLVNGETGEVSGQAPYSLIKQILLALFLLVVLGTTLMSGGAALAFWIPSLLLVWAVYALREKFRKDPG